MNIAAPEPHPYAEFLHRVMKPARYTGGEVGARRKAWTADVASVCLAFPDVYDIGMSHLGFKILYGILNDDPGTLAERCYAPWVDLEAELRARSLPLLSLESRRPLSAFDVVGFSLQFELTYTNILTMLDLGGVPLRAKDRGEDDPLVIAGGPVATHPEPIAPFLDALVIGDGERLAPLVAKTWKELKKAGVSRPDRLVALAHLGGVYVPALYGTTRVAETGLDAVDPPRDPSLPFPIERDLVDLKQYPFPDESPTGGPEAIFDRMSIEIARGCTEGCRFCQAGMIYRPVRERDPEEIVDTVVRSVKKSGVDEVSLTALSTADVSCISPLIKKVTDKLTAEKVSLGVSSLRAYGLEPELLDELKRVRATGLTFAPEAGTQRMRDVINKNVTEEQLLETAERVFSRGWHKMKLYFICGLPTETMEDVQGIIDTGARALKVGKRAAKGNAAEVVVSVSVHVPKPHTPFQWCALDTLEQIGEKQALLQREVRKHKGLKLRTHDAEGSVLEGVFARGDRRLAEVLETAWRNGARFDSWDDQLRLDVWEAAFDAHGIRPRELLGTLPVTARLPWSHIDVGLEDGFLEREYRKSLRSRLSPPCGKVAGTFVHHTNTAAAKADERRLVCYDCGVACDMTAMRTERVTFLEKLEAKNAADAEAPPLVGLRVAGDVYSYRLTYEKLGPVALLGHLDIVRELPRILKRADLTARYTAGFHPKPDMTYGPALSLGVMSLDEQVDVRLHDKLDTAALARLPALLTECAPEGLRFTSARALSPTGPSLSRAVRGAAYALVFARRALEPLAREAGAPSAQAFLEARVAELLGRDRIDVRRPVQNAPVRGVALNKLFDMKLYLRSLEVGGPTVGRAIERAGLAGDLLGVDAVTTILASGAVKASEIVEALVGDVPHHAIRTALVLGPPPTSIEEAREPQTSEPGPPPPVELGADPS
ncbi:MAG: TIGR03960 family B12-binding radical SAM protein [Polyangiaceae bacterium]